ncbi:MAG: site-2 protease family protein, partial [Thermomicrobiaceae bacterium]|nr:site-2 protease family protein [Thermomicrobiaceae bacterium]
MFPPSAFAVRWGGNAVAIHSRWLVAVVAAAALTVALLAPEDAALAQRLGWYASGAVLIAALIASLLVHEAGHAVVARWLGGPPLRSCIYPFGSAGVGFKTPSTPGHEIATALAGPVVSLAVTGATGLAYLALQRAAPMAATTVGWIALVNLGLAAINLLPGYPLDGGRVFRAMVWYLHDDYLTGTRAAVGYAEIISLMGIAGAVFLLGQDSPYPLVGLWALLLAWALNRSSRQE